MSSVKKVSAIYKTNLNTNHDEELILNVIFNLISINFLINNY